MICFIFSNDLAIANFPANIQIINNSYIIIYINYKCLKVLNI